MTSTDLIIIGAGPIGLELAVALARRGLDFLQFDAAQIGQTIYNFTPQTRFFSSCDRIAIAGVPLQTADQGKCTREEYLAYLRSIVQQFDLRIRAYEPVVDIQKKPEGFVLTTQARGSSQQYHCRRLVLATGGTAHPRRLGIPGEDLPQVTHRLEDPHLYFRRRLLVVGGKNSAVEAALRCHHAGAYVSLSYRRDHLDPKSIKYWLLPEINQLIDSGKISAYFSSVPTGITPTHVLLGEEKVVTDAVLVLIGFVADMTLCRMAGVELSPERQVPAFDPRTMESNVPGLYLAGTVIGGTQDNYQVFIENGHEHIDRIVAALTGAPPPAHAASVNPET
jgi:thioredoxin reductase (NADPH)